MNKLEQLFNLDDDAITDKLKHSYSEYIDLVDYDKRTLVHYAVIKNRIKILEFIIKNTKLNINIQDDNNWTPLHISSSSGYYDICKILLDNNADPKIVNISLQTPLHYACSKGHLDIVKLLVTKDHDIINLKDKYNRSPIFFACISGRIYIFKYLIEQGADIYVTEHGTNENLLHVALNGAHEDIAYILVDKDPDLLFHENVDGKTPINYANNTFCEEVKEILKMKKKTK